MNINIFSYRNTITFILFNLYLFILIFKYSFYFRDKTKPPMYMLKNFYYRKRSRHSARSTPIWMPKTCDDNQHESAVYFHPDIQLLPMETSSLEHSTSV